MKILKELALIWGTSFWMNDKNLSNLRDIESKNWWKKEREKYSGLK